MASVRRLYKIYEVLGTGTFGSVYRAELMGSAGFRKSLALKVLHPDRASSHDIVERLRDEARLLAHVSHPGVVQVSDLVLLDGSWTIILEHVPGASLRELIRQGSIPVICAVQMVERIAEALDAAHNAKDGAKPLNLVHRDIKPGNVMLSHDGVVKITDFGVAKATTNLFHTRAENITRGTPIYMSPEQVRGLRLDARSDIFALGSLSVEMITGQVVFQDTHLYRVLSKVDRAEVERPLHEVEQVVPGLAPILRTALQRDPRARYPSASAMAREVRAALSPFHGQVELAGWLREWMSAANALDDQRLSLEHPEDEERGDDSGPMAELALRVPSDEDMVRGGAANPEPGQRASGPGSASRVRAIDTDGDAPAYLVDVASPAGPRPSDELEILFPAPGEDISPGYLVEEQQRLEKPRPEEPQLEEIRLEEIRLEKPRLEDVSLSELKLADLVSGLQTGEPLNEVPTLEEGTAADDPAEAATAIDVPIPPLSSDAGQEGDDGGGDDGAGDLSEDDSPTLDEEDPLEPDETGDLPLAMTAIEPGSFWMGSAEVEVGRDADEELHEVRIGLPYFIGRIPVTQGQWARVMGDPRTHDSRDFPVAGVTWFDAVDFCIRLSEREGLASPYQVCKDGIAWDRDAAGYRLPTEAEWEFAARAGEYTRFAGSDHANSVAWHRGNALELLQPVARKSPNGHGLYDMSGNVCEWVWDRYGPYATQAENTDPTGPKDGKFRVQRGGSVYSPAADVRAARRHIDGRPDESRPHVGFRLARYLIG